MKTCLRNFWLLLFLVSGYSYASYYKALPVTITQPDGKVLAVFVTGNEIHNWYHDSLNFTIIKNEATGYFEYAKLNATQEVIPSGYKVGETNPSFVGLMPGINISSAAYEAKVREYKASHEDVLTGGYQYAGVEAAPNFGSQMNELVIFIRLSNQPTFTRPLSYFENSFNSLTQTSVRGFYKEVSQNKIDIKTYFYPNQTSSTVVTYNHYRPRTYYQKNTPDGYGAGGTSSTDREHSLLVDAVNAVKNQVPASLLTDANNDGNIDNVVFIIQGDPDGWGELLWPHRWVLYTKNVSIQGKRVWDYNLTFENGSGPGVLSHELFHTFGAPDLYRYTNPVITPTGGWDVMSGGDWAVPQHMNTYHKMKFGGWFDNIPVINSAGTYTLDPVSRNPFSCYKIMIPNSTEGEFLLLEYRKKEGLYEKALPGEGLVVYRVNPGRSGNPGDAPDEMYVYRPGGSLTVDGNLSQAGFSATYNRTRLDDYSNPSTFMTNGQRAGFEPGLGITNVSVIGNTISFSFKGGCQISGTKLTGTVIGSSGSWSNLGDTKEKALDGNTSTFFDAPVGDNQWVGYDLGKPCQITSVKYFPRTGFEARMVQGKFQASSTPDFSSNVVDLHTITATPASQNWVCVSNVNVSGVYQYVRYIGPPISHCNVNEIEWYGTSIAVSAIPGKIEAESFTSQFGIQTQATTDAGGGQNVGWIENGDWVDFWVNVQRNATYTAQFRVASATSGGTILVKKGSTVLATISVSGTGGWQTWTTVSKDISLTSGVQLLRLEFQGPAGSLMNLNYWSAQEKVIVNDCNGTPNGTAYVDACGICVGGTTGKVTTDANNNGIPDCKEVISSCTAIQGSGVTWAVRNDWSDQNNGSQITYNASDASYRVQHRQWGRTHLWLAATNQPLEVQAGKTYEFVLDVKDDAAFRLSNIEVGLASSLLGMHRYWFSRL
ncbi:MAG: M6 family metalloprotease domain-containing protein [Cytophagaceae bacterium]